MIMKVLVYDVAAESSGVLSILYDFRKSLDTLGKDIEWYFVIGKAQIETADNIHVFSMPEAKKSWFHRLYVDNVVMPRFVKKHGIDVIFSLQNVCVPRVRQPQYVYMHQPIPFESYRFSFFKKEERILFLHQNVISHFIFTSIRKAKKVIVQTCWIKDKCREKVGVPEDKFLVIPPTISEELIQKFRIESLAGDITFFYPATPFSYKNHAELFRAAHELKKRGFHRFEIVLTAPDVQTFGKDCRVIYPGLENHIRFLGVVPRMDIMQMFTRSVLLFPSMVETFGLPLLEARLTGSPIIASDLGFAHEILDGYANARFFNPADYHMLADYMQTFIEHTVDYQPDHSAMDQTAYGWADIIDAIREGR